MALLLTCVIDFCEETSTLLTRCEIWKAVLHQRRSVSRHAVCF
jgi:hypothetical protein